MRNTTLKARDAALHAVWQSGTIGIDLKHGFRMKIHDDHPDAPPSPIYVSLRPKGVKSGQLEPEHLIAIGDALSALAVEKRVFSGHTWVTGIPAAGEPILGAIKTTIGPRRSKRLLEFKLEKIEDDSGRRIAGIHPEYQHLVPCDATDAVVLVDDLMTNLATKMEAIDAVEAHGCRVSTLLLFLDRSDGGIPRLKTERGVDTHAVIDYGGLLDFGLAQGYLNRRTYERVIEYPSQLERYLAETR